MQKRMFNVRPENRAQYYKYLAMMNFEAANAADDVIGYFPGYEFAAPPPVMSLCAHCIELSLKAYLLDKRVQEHKVKSLGHNLVNCWRACIENGVDEKMLDWHLLEILSDLVVSNRLRYGEESKLGKIPVYGPLSTLCEKALALCGAPTRELIFGEN